MMMRLATHTAARTSALVNTQQSCSLERLGERRSGRLHANIEHPMLTDMVALEKSVCDQRATQPWALERAIVIFSDHVQSMVGMLVLTAFGQRAGGTHQRFAARSPRFARSVAAVRQGARAWNTGCCCGAWVCARAIPVCEPKPRSFKMTTSGAGQIQTSIKGEAVRCEEACADQSKMAAT
jgi:hypothetical protein